jgi:hypothetical protein
VLCSQSLVDGLDREMVGVGPDVSVINDNGNSHLFAGFTYIVSFYGTVLFMVVRDRVLLLKASQGRDVGIRSGFETKRWVGSPLNLCKVIERRVMSLRWFTK